MFVEKQIDAVLFDIDGVLEFQGKPYPGAIELITELRNRSVPIRVISNSTLKSRNSAASKLRQRGFDVEEEEVITASYATAQYLSSVDARSCWILLTREGLDEFSRFVHNDTDPEYVVVGDYREKFTFETLNKAARCIVNGSKLVVMIPEMIDNSMGGLELTVGAYGRMLEEACKVKAVYIGKPSHFMFDAILSTLPEIPRQRVLMVGDKVSTDILGAKNAGLQSALVKTGEYRDSDLDSGIDPDYVLDSVAEVGSIIWQ